MLSSIPVGKAVRAKRWSGRFQLSPGRRRRRRKRKEHQQRRRRQQHVFFAVNAVAGNPRSNIFLRPHLTLSHLIREFGVSEKELAAGIFLATGKGRRKNDKEEKEQGFAVKKRRKNMQSRLYISRRLGMCHDGMSF